MSDRIFGGIGLLLALIFAYQATIIQESFLSDAVGPKTFPLIIATVLAITSIFFLLKPDPEPSWPTLGRFAEIAFAALVMIAYAEMLPEVGFLIATAVASMYLTWRLGTAPLASVIVGVATSVGIFVVFKLILGLSLASGPFGF